MNIDEHRKKLLDRLNALKIFPNNNEVRILRARTQKALDRLEKPTKKLKPKIHSNKRSAALKRHHRYIRLVRDNVPHLPYGVVRELFSKRKKGEGVSIPDAIWETPSL